MRKQSNAALSHTGSERSVRREAGPPPGVPLNRMHASRNAGDDQPDTDGERTDGRPVDGSPGGGPEQPNLRRWMWGAIALFILMPLVGSFFGAAGRPTVSYTEFRTQVSDGNVREVTISGNRVVGVYREGSEAADRDGGLFGGNDNTFVTFVPTVGSDDIVQFLRANEVTINARAAGDRTSPLQILFNLLPLILLGWIGFRVLRATRQGGGAGGGGGGPGGIFGIGKNKAKLYERSEHVKTTFDDVAGLSGAREEVGEIIDFLREPEKFAALGAKTPKGVLLVGPPGTGKTLLARAIAGEAEVPFYSMSGSDFMEMFVGVGASRVRSLFKDARKKQPTIIFIDELDSIGRHRGAGLGGGHDEREQTLNQLLSELDGFEPTESVVVLAATNRPDILDPALLRPGRFDRRVTTSLPSKLDREAILEIHAANKPLADDVDLSQVARGTPGFSGADLANLLNEASLLAARRDSRTIAMDDITAARDKVLLGLERHNLTISDHERRIVAYHESGHAVVAATLPHSDPLLKVTIVPHERSMGVTQQLPQEEKYLYGEPYLRDRLAVMLAGRAAEELVFETFTNGAQNDLHQATQLARKMVVDWGMSRQLGPFAAGGEQGNVFLGEELSRRRDYSEQTAREIDEEVMALLAGAYRRARDTLAERRRRLDAIAEALLEREELSAAEVGERL